MGRTLVLLIGIALLWPSQSTAQTVTPEVVDSAGEALTRILTSVEFGDEDVETLIGVLQAQVTTFPIGSSSGGFTWRFDPRVGAPTRRTRSFGPLFAER